MTAEELATQFANSVVEKELKKEVPYGKIPQLWREAQKDTIPTLANIALGVCNWIVEHYNLEPKND